MDAEQTFIRVQERFSQILTPKVRAALEYIYLFIAITLFCILVVMHANYVQQPGCSSELSGVETTEAQIIQIKVKLREFIPSILNVSRQCLAAGEEDVAIIAFEFFDELIESPAPLLGKSVKSIVQFSLEVCSSQSLESNTRHQAVQIVSWLAKYKSNSLKKHKLVIPILQVMCPLLAESNDEDKDDDLAPDRAAAEVIDTMALNIPKHVLHRL